MGFIYVGFEKPKTFWFESTSRLKKIAVFENTQKKWFVESFYTHPLRQKSWFAKTSHERILRKSAKPIFFICT
jgi:hypothetical protein